VASHELSRLAEVMQQVAALAPLNDTDRLPCRD
jgi:hypothetical protein